MSSSAIRRSSEQSFSSRNAALITSTLSAVPIPTFLAWPTIASTGSARRTIIFGRCTPEDPIAGRAGLVGTQNIRNNQSRVGGLDYVVQTGTIVEAVDNQPWSGEANVHVSIANWVKSKNHELLPSLRRLWFKTDVRLGDKDSRTRNWSIIERV